MQASHGSRWRPHGLVTVALLFAATAPACAPVPAYARGKLAHPTMAPQFASSASRDHREAVQEGAAGGSVDVASGCGCN